MKQIAIVIVLCMGAWYFFIGGRKLDESMVRDYYQQEARAVSANDADKLCKQLSRKAVVEAKTTMMGRTEEVSLDRDEACAATRKTMETLRRVNDQVGAILAIEYDYHIDTVEVASDRKSAVVKGTSVMKMGDSALQLKTSFNQRLERELGQMRLVHAEDSTVVRLGGRGVMSQSDFFRK
ncbi:MULTISPECIES: hypothetical protein [unclassified Variovorax]|uniref:hypothetical protein n=1 Tax=unclassified Variovorax TaxID=663243 RepID=UPI0008C5F492|nr:MULTISPECIES: hypothetical protein [unclassified Variovorax]SEJ15957.1 hypothetical protein SAMN05518853_101816 [Variovorax sp. OK202]SFC06629.1 hypothetical protein SAMN05444746_101816 [Variovorax sp. OK212]